MRWLITALMVALVAAGGAWLAVGEKLRPILGLPEAAPPVAQSSPSLQALAELRPDKVRKLDLTLPDGAELTLTRTADGDWRQPGNWPVREAEATTLLNALAGLQTRFRPITLDDDADLTAYGLADNAKTVTVGVGLEGRSLTLHFGQPKPEAGQSTFNLPTYLRVDQAKEIIRLGPDVFSVVSRPSETYRRRQLFATGDRVRVSGGGEPDQPTAVPTPARVAILDDNYLSLNLERAGEAPAKFTLKRVKPTPAPRRDADQPSAEAGLTPDQLAEAWQLEIPGETPIVDRVEPEKLREVLTTVPEIWVEQFVRQSPQEVGLNDSAYTLGVQRADGSVVNLRLGSVSRTVNRVEEQPPPSPFAPPPPPPKVTTEEYRYAKLDDNPLVFEVRADPIIELFTTVNDYRDPKLLRLTSAEVDALTIQMPGQSPIELGKKRGDSQAASQAERRDRWYVGDMLADNERVRELVDKLVGMEAAGPNNWLDNLTKEQLQERGLGDNATSITLRWQPRVAEGEPKPEQRQAVVTIGKVDAESEKLPVKVGGWERVNLVDDSLESLLQRPALAYRSRQLFDTAAASLDAIAVQPDDGKPFALRQELDPANPAQTLWTLAKPVTIPIDKERSQRLADRLGELEVVEYVDEQPTPEKLQAFGLDKPRFRVTLDFAGQPERQLALGKSRDDKDEIYARLDDAGSVFTVSEEIVNQLSGGVVSLLPLNLWELRSDQLTGVDVRRGPEANGEAYRLTQSGDGRWQLTGPFDAPVRFPDLQPLLSTAGTVKADKYVAFMPDQLGEYGLDKPHLRLGISFQGEADQQPTRKTLVIGQPADTPNTRYAMVEGEPATAVFVIPDELARQADRPALDWPSKLLLSVDPSTVTQLSIAGKSQVEPLKLNKQDDGRWQVEGSDFPVDTPTISDLLAAVSRPPVLRLAGYGPSVKWAEHQLDEPDYAITITMAAPDGDKPRSHTLKIGKAGDDDERFFRVDDGPALAVLSQEIVNDLTPGKLDLVDKNLVSFDPVEMTAMSREMGKEELAFSRSGLGWEVEKPAKFKADEPTLDAIAGQLSRLRATQVAAYKPDEKELEKFGLKEPTAVWTFDTTDGQPRRLELGNPVNPKAKGPAQDRYVLARPSGDDKPGTVGVIPGDLADRLLAEPIGFRDKFLAGLSDVSKATLERDDRSVTFADVDGDWKMTQPIEADSEELELIRFLQIMSKLRADALVEDPAKDRKKYGLDKPALTWSFFDGDKLQYKLLVGKRENGQAFAQVDGQTAVAKLSPSVTAQLFAEYRKRAVFSGLDAAQVQTLVISTGDANAVLRKQNGVWIDPAKPDEPLDQDKVSETLTTLARLQAERYVVDQDAGLELYGLDQPARVLVVTMANGSSHSLRLGNAVGDTDGKQVYAAVADPARSDVFVLSAKDTATLTRDRSAYSQKPPKAKK